MMATLIWLRPSGFVREMVRGSFFIDTLKNFGSIKVYFILENPVLRPPFPQCVPG